MSISLYAITFDCADAAAQAEFWSKAFRLPMDPGGSEDYASIGLEGKSNKGPSMMFNKVPEGKTAKNRVHLDLITADLAGEVRRLVSLGARRGKEFKEDGSRWVTLSDPEGNELDVIAK